MNDHQETSPQITGTFVASRREVKALVELHVPFEPASSANAICRAASHAGCQSKSFAPRSTSSIAWRSAIIDGYAAAGTGGIRQGTGNPILKLPGYALVNQPLSPPCAPENGRLSKAR